MTDEVETKIEAYLNRRSQRLRTAVPTGEFAKDVWKAKDDRMLVRFASGNSVAQRQINTYLTARDESFYQKIKSLRVRAPLSESFRQTAAWLVSWVHA